MIDRARSLQSILNPKCTSQRMLLRCRTRDTLGPLGQPERAMGHESQIELWSPFDRRSGLLFSELIGFVAAMKTPIAGPRCPATEHTVWPVKTESCSDLAKSVLKLFQPEIFLVSYKDCKN